MIKYNRIINIVLNPKTITGIIISFGGLYWAFKDFQFQEFANSLNQVKYFYVFGAMFFMEKRPQKTCFATFLKREWMSKNRPKIKRMIYISSTGVYPKRNGLWHEDSEFEPDTNSGKLRLITEKTLGSFFKLHVVRPGGIYGNGRGIDVRLKSGKHIPVSGTPVHRIHVNDLAGIVYHLLKNPESARCVNAVDFDPKPSWKVAHWLVQNLEDLSEDMLQDIPDSSASIPGNTQHLISNKCLIELGITLSYPTFREGMGSMTLNS